MSSFANDILREFSRTNLHKEGFELGESMMLSYFDGLEKDGQKVTDREKLDFRMGFLLGYITKGVRL